MKFKTFIPLLITLLFFSCKSSPKTEGVAFSPVYITNSKKYYLISPENVKIPFEKQILLDADFGKNSFSCLSYLKADSEELYINLFTEFGASLGELYFNGTEVSLNSNAFPKNLKPEYIIADLQFAFYDFDEIKNSLEQINLSFEKTENSKIIKDKSKIIEKITTEKNSTIIENFLRKYKYTLQEAE